jgi:hypothetical protein
VLNVVSDQGNANQNYTEIPSHPSQNSSHKENKKTTNIGEDVGEKKELLFSAGRNVNSSSHYGNHYGRFFKKLKNRSLM